MTTFDLTPLARTSIGFDRLMEMVDAAMQSDGTSEAYPPYNIEQSGDDTYRITMAVAGFAEEDLSVTIHSHTLIIKGRSHPANASTKYLYRGIAGRAFEKHFQLADFIKIGAASLCNGLLSVELIREIPETMRPRNIEIQSEDSSKSSGQAGKIIEQTA
ncbi:MAG: Hsp20 family protein [Pseudomonadota bacterium]